MSINTQQLISAHLLSVMRAAEQRLGLASVRHFYQPIRQFPQLAGTQYRPARNVTEIKDAEGAVTARLTRGDRKRASRARAVEAILGGRTVLG